MTFTIKSNTDQIVKSIEAWPKLMKREIKQALTGFGYRITARMRTEGFSGNPRLQRRTGQMSRSQGHEMIDDNTLLIFNTAKYAHLQEEGGTVTAKRGMLAIPIGEALNPSGVPRWASPLRSSGIEAKYGKLFVLKLYGTAFLCAKSYSGFNILSGRGSSHAGTIVPLFVLKKSVKIPGRYGLRKTVEEERPALSDDLGQRAADVWAGGKIFGGAT